MVRTTNTQFTPGQVLSKEEKKCNKEEGDDANITMPIRGEYVAVCVMSDHDH